MSEIINYVKYRTLCPIQEECLRNISCEAQVIVHGKVFRTTDKGTVLDLSYNDSEPEKIDRICSVEEIEGLDKLENLTVLNLYAQSLKDISGLTCLKKLTHLNLSINLGVDVKPLESMQNLRELNLFHAFAENVSSIGKLKNLEVLDLGRNKINQIDFLENLRKLRKLSIYFNDIEKIDAISGMNQLVELNISSNKIREIDCLEYLSGLCKLNLEHNPIQSYYVLKSLDNLREVSLSKIGRCQWYYGSDIKLAIEAWYEQNVVVFGNTYRTTECGRVLDLSFRNGNRKIHSLNEIEGLDKLERLETLILRDNEITDITKLQFLKTLKILNLRGNKIRDLFSLQQLNELRELDLVSTGITDLQVLCHLKKLEILRLDSFSECDREQNWIVLDSLERLKNLTFGSELNLDGEAGLLLVKYLHAEGKADLIEHFSGKRYGSSKEIKLLIAERKQYFSDLREKEERERTKIRQEFIASVQNPQIKESGSLFKKYDVSWDYVRFGSYPQKRNEAGYFFKEPICWRILHIENGIAVLLAEQILDVVEFGENILKLKEAEYVSGQYSRIKCALNYVSSMKHGGFVSKTIGYKFYEEAFSQQERDVIVGEVGLLQYEHMVNCLYSKYGFNYEGKMIKEACRARCTDYALDKGLKTEDQNGSWLIGTAGFDMERALFVDESGKLDKKGIHKSKLLGIRPMIVVDFNKIDPVEGAMSVSVKEKGYEVRNE